MLTARAILASAYPAEPAKSGIYFLIRAGQIIYVGQSVDIAARIAAHAARKTFDHWSWVPCERTHLNAMERAYIERFMPAENLDSRTRRVRWESRSPERSVKVTPPSWPFEIAGSAETDDGEAEREDVTLRDKMRGLRAMRRPAADLALYSAE